MTVLDKILPTAKAWCALVGAVATALLGTYGPETQAGKVLTIVIAVATAIVVFAVPNTPAPTHRATRDERGVSNGIYLLGLAIIVFVILWGTGVIRFR